MGWKIIEIEQAHQISLFLDNIVILKENDRITIPLNDIDVLLINNSQIKVSIQLLNSLANKNILTIICDNQYLPCSINVPIIGNYNTLKIFEKQLNWNHQFKSNLWVKIIKQKILNQADLVNFFKLDNNTYNELIQLSNNIREYDISNREGHASKIYWHCLFGIKWKRFDDDYINKLLNYGYTILRSYFTRSIIKKGLDPRISIFHKSFHNYFALSSDLMEPFRILIDYEVYRIYKTGEIDFYNHKQILINLFNNKILLDDKYQFVNNAIDLFIDSIINEQNLPKLNFLELSKEND